MSGERQRRIKRALAAVFGAAAACRFVYSPSAVPRPQGFRRAMSFLWNDTDDRSAFAIGLCRCVGAEPLYAVLFAVCAPLGRFGSGAVCKGQTAAAF